MKKQMYIKGGYLKNNPTWHTEDSYWKAGQIIKIIEKNNIQPNSICEVGCGAGEVLNQLHNRLSNKILFNGYEISPQAFELCQQRKKERLCYHLEDILQNKNAFFDIILVIDVLEHVEDYFGFLRNIRKKGKYKIFHIPLDMSVQKILHISTIISQRQNQGHIHYFAKETALSTLIDADYEIIDYFYTDYVIDLPAKSLELLLVKQMLKIMYRLNKDMAVRIIGGSSLMVLTK